MGQKTYWHLIPRRRIPSEYDVASSRLLYYPGRGLSVATPVAAWHARRQAAVPVAGTGWSSIDWERFEDPRRTTYAAYVARRRDREGFVDGLLASIDGGDYDRRLPPAWLAVLDRVIAPARYPCHGLQMVAAYVGHLAPAGKIAIAAGFQAADEMRRVHRLAYRLRQLQRTHPELGADSRAAWERDPLWQPLREAVERLLVAYDWGESFVGLALALKPAFDAVFTDHLGRLARRSGDDVLERLLFSFGEDARWHREWAAALVRTALAEAPACAAAFGEWLARWRPRARRAVEALRPVFEEMPDPEARLDFDAVLAAVSAVSDDLLSACGLGGGGGV